MTVNEQVKVYRKANKLTQEKLANMIGVKRYTLQRWEHSKVKISPAMIKLLKYEGIL